MSRTKNQRLFIKYCDSIDADEIKRKYRRVVLYCLSLARKKDGSKNSLEIVIKQASRIYGLLEVIKQTRIKRNTEIDYPDLSYEKKILNERLLGYVKKQISKRRKNRKIFFGENLLNAYCDVIFLATNLDDDRRNNIRPKILTNHKTGRCLELDIYFGKIKFALEFQGEQHYVKDEIKERDKLKLDLSKINSIMLSPINPIQMPNENLTKLIANTAKDFFQMGDENGNLKVNENVKYRNHIVLFKIIQRYDLAESLFQESLNYLDSIINTYIERIKRYSPISTTQCAPKIAPESGDKDIELLHKQIPNVYRLLKKKNKKEIEICK